MLRFTTRISLKDIGYPNPIANVEKIKVQEQEQALLTHEDITKLFKAIEGERSRLNEANYIYIDWPYEVEYALSNK
ncbi:hypothetical protein [Pseudoalteromonas luteoviolacea]|uniref:hypothetical protein n=1 Tax=Pseudoalteromonas luteoviolacea TaxID=43657 RepID=UPI001B39B1C1|nr:hypothetical protein [Pseudoalteromonas luteoviolacea]MBQ4837348.1 hypothetical protein [Pseudoalteromonas luteoviolacea]